MNVSVRFTVLAILLVPAAGYAATTYVSNNGLDSSFCGTSAQTACRSIGQGIANSGSGATVQVGPGVYGDINDDGVFTPFSGDESPAFSAVINVDKELVLISRDGANSTVILFSSGGGVANSGVQLNSPGIVFGRKHRGFTILSKGRDCSKAVTATPNAPGSSINGNVAIGCVTGVHASALNMTVKNNRASQNFRGFELQGSDLTLTFNSASGNDDIGLFIEVDGFTAERNVSVGNGSHGVVLDGRGEFTNNAVSGNLGVGVSVQGFLVFPSLPTYVIEDNSIYGNGTAPFFPADENCGTVNNTLLPFLDARNNYWGQETGPGTDPADEACGNRTVVEPYTSGEANLKLTPVR